MLNSAFRALTYFLLVTVLAISCTKENHSPTVIQFTEPSIEVSEFGGGEDIQIAFSRPLQSNITLMIDVTDSTAVYGKDYTTLPEANDDKKIILHVAKNYTSASFKFVPIQSSEIKSSRATRFTLGGSNDHVVYGEMKTISATIADDSRFVNFVANAGSVNESAQTKKIYLAFSSPLLLDGNLLIKVTDSTTVYGVDYVTTPAAIANTITIPVSKGATSASFTLAPMVQSSTDGDRIVNFSISGVSQGMHLGTVVKNTTTILDDDLVCYLPMKGNAKDASDYANATTVEGATLTTGRKGSPNSAYELDGVSSDIIIPTSSALENIQNITLTAWIKPVSFDGVGNNGIIEKAYSSHVNPYYQYKLGITGDQHSHLPGCFALSLSVNGTYQILPSSAGTWTPGNWYFVAGTYDGSNMKLYVNGSLVATLPMTGTVDHWGTDIYLGKVNNADIYTPGTLGDIRIYNRALSANEISSLYLR